MKKLFSMLLCLILIFTLAACGGGDDIRGDISSIVSDTAEELNSSEATNDSSSEVVTASSEVSGQTSETTNASSEVVSSVNEAVSSEAVQSGNSQEDFTFGKTAGYSYKNEFLGLGLELKSGWVFYTDEQIKELNNIANSYTDDEVKQAIENANIIYDMYASTEDMLSNVNINLEKRSILESGSTQTIKQMLSNTLGAMKSTYENMGYTNVSFEVVDVVIDGQTFAGVKGKAQIQGLDFYSTVFCIKKGRYLANISIASFDANEVQSLLDSFYLF